MCAYSGIMQYPHLTEAEKTHCESRVTAVQCYWRCDGNLPKAIALFKAQWNKQYDADSEFYIREVRKFITYNVAKLEKRFTLLDIQEGGRPTTVPNEVALECAELLAAGYFQERYAQQGAERIRYLEHCWFTSMRDAVMSTARLQQVLEQYDVTTDHLLRRMHQVDKKLVYGPVQMKGVMPEHAKKKRVFYSVDLLSKLQANPDNLLDVFFMDECRIWIGRDLCGKLRVWSHRGDMEGEPPEANQFMGRGKGFKTNLLLVVNARHGCVWAELLQGTTGLKPQDRHNAAMRAMMQQRGYQPYKVSYLNRMQLDSQ